MDSNPGNRTELSPATAGVLRFLRRVRRLPADLAAVAAFVVLTNVTVLAPVVRETPLRVVFGLAFVLFVPGYAFIAALFPEAGEPMGDRDEATGSAESGDDAADSGWTDLAEGPYFRGGGIDGIERVALSFGLSIAIVPLIGLVLNFTPWGIRLVPILVSLSGFTLVMTAVAAYRRWELPVDERFRVPYREWTAAAHSELFEPDTRIDAVLNVVLVLSVIVAASTVGYAVMVPQDGERFSEFYLLTETDDGELVADDYPTEFAPGEGRELVVGIGNQEHERTSYTVVVQLQRVEFVTNATTPENASTPAAENASTALSANATANVSTRVLRSERLDTYSTTLPHNETWHRQVTVSPTFEGTNLRLAFLLYRGDSVPERPTVDNAYRETHLWVNVTQGADSGDQSLSVNRLSDQ